MYTKHQQIESMPNSPNTRRPLGVGPFIEGWAWGRSKNVRSELSFWRNHSCRRDTAHIKLQWTGAAQVYLVTGICRTRGVQGGSAITLAHREDHRHHRSGRTSDSEVNRSWLGKAWKCPEWKYIWKVRAWDCLADSPQLWGNREG